MALEIRARPVREADNLTVFCEPIVSHNPIGLHGL
jgi:hypothetical protein